MKSLDFQTRSGARLQLPQGLQAPSVAKSLCLQLLLRTLLNSYAETKDCRAHSSGFVSLAWLFQLCFVKESHVTAQSPDRKSCGPNPKHTLNPDPRSPSKATCWVLGPSTESQPGNDRNISGAQQSSKVTKKDPLFLGSIGTDKRLETGPDGREEGGSRCGLPQLGKGLSRLGTFHYGSLQSPSRSTVCFCAGLTTKRMRLHQRLLQDVKIPR